MLIYWSSRTFLQHELCVYLRKGQHAFIILNFRQITELYFKLSNVLIKIKSLRNVSVGVFNECV